MHIPCNREPTSSAIAPSWKLSLHSYWWSHIHQCCGEPYPDTTPQALTDMSPLIRQPAFNSVACHLLPKLHPFKLYKQPYCLWKMIFSFWDICVVHVLRFLSWVAIYSWPGPTGPCWVLSWGSSHPVSTQGASLGRGHDGSSWPVRQCLASPLLVEPWKSVVGKRNDNLCLYV